jgi:hypothetical protein
MNHSITGNNIKIGGHAILGHVTMALSNKVLLNNLCQSHKWDFPVYKTIRTGGQDHLPLFSSSVSFFGTLFKSNEYSSKKDSEDDVAKQIITYYNKHHSVTKFPPISQNFIEKEICKSSTSKIIPSKIIPSKITSSKIIPSTSTSKIQTIYVLVDYENIKITDDFVNFCLSKNINLIAFFSKSKYVDDCDYKFPIKIVNSTRKDVADVAILSYATSLVILKKADIIYLISKDHIMSNLHDVIHSDIMSILEEDKINIIHCTSLKETTNHINNL